MAAVSVHWQPKKETAMSGKPDKWMGQRIRMRRRLYAAGIGERKDCASRVIVSGSLKKGR